MEGTSLRTLRLDLAYDGTEFHGWQFQPALRTVQGVLQDCLQRALGESHDVVAAGRTDAGCHARGQVVSFRSRTRLPASAFPPVLNRLLPSDVRVTGASEREDGFDARRSAVARRYAYRLLDAPDVLLERLAWYPRRPIEPERLERAVRPLEGDHDCSAFRARGCSARRTECRVHRASWRRWEGGWMLDIVADHFLYRMVRNVVGTALALMEHDDPALAMADVLGSRRRSAAGSTAPPQGLCLEQVFYGEMP